MKLLRRFLSVLILLTLCFCACSCTKSDKKDNQSNTESMGNTANMVNPMTEYNSLEEINSIAGSKLSHPAVMGVSDEKFFIYKGYSQPLAEYRFKLNGLEYNFRCCAVGKTDISGLYVGGKTVFSAEPEKDFETYFGSEYKSARWFTLDGQYILTVTDNNTMDEETFLSICNELKARTAVSNG